MGNLISKIGNILFKKRMKRVLEVNSKSIDFNYTNGDRKLFTDDQHRHWDNIKENYFVLSKKILLKVVLPQTGSHKGWITSRVELHVSQSLMRILYLVEEFCHASENFNSVAVAALVKSISEIPLHLGYIVWVLSENHDFEKIRTELRKISFGNINPKSGLTGSLKITQRELYERSDQMMRKFFKDQPGFDIFESLYKDSNAIGHHNYEARMLTGIQNGDTWKAGDRKELFVFFSNNIFQIFMYCDAALSMSKILLSAIDHYLSHLPENFTSFGG